MQLQEELLGEPTVIAPSKKQLKRQNKLNKQKNASSPTILDAVSDDTSASAEADVSKLTVQLQKKMLDEPTDSKGGPSWKPVPLPPSDRETASISSTILPAAAVRKPSKVATCAAPQLAISASSFEPASAALVNESTKGDPFQEAIASLKEPNILKFSDALKVFRKDFDATIEEGAIYTISLRGPNGLTNIYCHSSHGAQDVKRWPAWRINMKEGLRAAGYEW